VFAGQPFGKTVGVQERLGLFGFFDEERMMILPNWSILSPMKTMILLVSLAISAVDATAQNTVSKTSNDSCGRSSNKSFSARLKNYPFNLAARVLLVSYVGLEPVKPGDSAYVNKGLPRENDSVCYSKLKEIKTLTLPQVDQLTDILFNYGFIGHYHSVTTAMCFMPHNAILFVDKGGKTFAYIDICFLCNRIEKSSTRISLGDMCEGKFDLIRAFFRKTGVEYAVTKDVYP
jgi:hypothetical protein